MRAIQELAGQWQLVSAAAVGVVAAALIALSAPAWSGDAVASGIDNHFFERHHRVLAEMREAGLEGIVDVVDYPDGVGLGVTQHAEANATLLRVPRALVLDVRRGAAESCNASREECQAERSVAAAVRSGAATRLQGLVALLVVEFRRAAGVEGLTPSPLSAALALLPEPEANVFTVDQEEFDLCSAGTSMESYRTSANAEADAAHAYAMEALEALPGIQPVPLEEVRRADLFLHAYGQWPDELAGPEVPEAGLDLPARVLFLWPLLLARPTLEWEHGVRLLERNGSYDVVATHAMRPGDELHSVDRRLSDASSFCFRGTWLSGHHRMLLALNVDSAPRDPNSQATLDKYGCGARPLRFYVQPESWRDGLLLGCMRMLALASEARKLRKAEKQGWMRDWPRTLPLGQRSEVMAMDLAITALQQVLQRLSGTSPPIGKKFGSDSLAERPAIKVREAETSVVVALLKAMKELQLAARRMADEASSKPA